MEKDYDCTNYNDCPKGSIIRESKNTDLSVIMVGCWGVYCWNGPVSVAGYNADKHKLIMEKEKIYGQKLVADGMANFVRKYHVDAVFLAGDNVYADNDHKPELVKRWIYDNYPTKKEYKSDYAISPQNIEKQIEEGFMKCFNKVGVDNFFIAIGNHDVQTCHELNYQINYSRKYPKNRFMLPGVYYNVIYDMNQGKRNSYKVNFIVLETNMYENGAKQCSGKDYTPDMIKEQNEWVIDTLRDNNCRWNIIVGHIPYKANPHKDLGDSVNIIKNKKLDELFHRISVTPGLPKVQVYMCADEHNQQFLYDDKQKLGLVVAGSGGTVLDMNIIDGNYMKDNDEKVYTLYRGSYFGFTKFSFTPDELIVDYIVTDTKFTSTGKPKINSSFRFRPDGFLTVKN